MEGIKVLTTILIVERLIGLVLVVGFVGMFIWYVIKNPDEF